MLLVLLAAIALSPAEQVESELLVNDFHATCTIVDCGYRVYYAPEDLEAFDTLWFPLCAALACVGLVEADGDFEGYVAVIFGETHKYYFSMENTVRLYLLCTHDRGRLSDIRLGEFVNANVLAFEDE